MLILGIETSCDETAASVIEDGQVVRSNIVSSQWALHARHGGVVPELAARAQVTAILPVIEQALKEAGIGRQEIDAIAVAYGPGLAGSLLVGVNAAKALAWSLEKPLIPVNHLEAHLYANWLLPGDPPTFPALCLLVSGGHTELILMTDHGQYQHLGRTLDDAAGEAFDKSARLLGLGSPGGPAIQNAARGGDPQAFELPRAWLGESENFSFSGLKTALLRLVEPYRLAPPVTLYDPSTPFTIHQPPRYSEEMPVDDLAASFQEAVVDVLATKLSAAADRNQVASIMLAGGVSANAAMRERVKSEFQNGQPLFVPPLQYCTDNAAMVAACAFFVQDRGVEEPWKLDVEPRLSLSSVT